MSLGKRISTLRAEKRLSQGDLAEKLEVSRQSVSKWETDSSVPDLDKLVKLSEVFGVSLDELVLGDKKEEIPPKETETPPVIQQVVIQKKETPGNIKLSYFFLSIAAAVFFVLTVMGIPVAGLVYAMPFLLLAGVCVIVKKHTALTVTWILYYIVDAFFLYATGIRWQSIRYTFQWTEHMNYMRLAFSWVLFFLMVALTLYTLWTFRKVEFKKKNTLRFVLGWVLYLVLSFPVQRLLSHWIMAGYVRWLYLISNLIGWFCFALLNVLLVYSLALVRKKIQ